MVQNLEWESLQHRRYRDRLSTLVRDQLDLVDITTDYIQPNDVRTRGSQRLRQLHVTNDVYKSSFYPRTKSDWNRLPTNVTDVQPLLVLREGLSSLIPSSCSCDPTRLTPPVLSFSRRSGAFYPFSRVSQFLHRVTYNLRRLLPLQWKKKKKKKTISKGGTHIEDLT